MTSTTQPAAPDLPEGYSHSRRHSNYLDLVGPIYEAGEGDTYRIGLRVSTQHANARGICHGGLLATLADTCLTRLAMIAAHGPESMGARGFAPMVTIHLGLDYLGPARLGDWLEASGRLDRAGRKVIYTSGTITANGKPSMRMTGIFQVKGEGPSDG
jgi:uncharacterized protein (TIGR00369 family)